MEIVGEKLGPSIMGNGGPEYLASLRLKSGKYLWKRIVRPEKFAELVEVEGIIPAPYMARNHWVAMIEIDALRPPEIKELIRHSYQLVLEKLPQKTQAALSAHPAARAVESKPAPRAKRRR